jgi:hypothetical protein
LSAAEASNVSAERPVIFTPSESETSTAATRAFVMPAMAAHRGFDEVGGAVSS